jgi:ABC-type transport system involved in multi-copper enzyme maturation permease subunit
MAARARGHLGVLVRYDLAHSLSSPRGLLFLVFFSLVWTWLLVKLGGGLAKQFGSPEAGFMLSWLFSEGVSRLFAERPPTSAAYFLVAVTLTPLFAMLGSADQTANDLGSKHLRFLIPRVGRAEIFLARAIGAAVLVLGAQLLAGIAACIVSVVVHPDEVKTVVLYCLAATGMVMVYSLPFVALMSLVAAVMGSVGLSMLVGIGGYAVLLLTLSFSIPDEGKARAVTYLLPSGLKPHLLQPELGPALAALGACFAYVAVFGLLGWRIFRSRDA